MPMNIDWTKVDSKIVAVAMDENGLIEGYMKQPFEDRDAHGWAYFPPGDSWYLGNPLFPASALLTPYHPRDWQNSLTLPPAPLPTYTEAQYKAMAERKQFGVFWDIDASDAMQKGVLGQIVKAEHSLFYEANGATWDHFLPLRPLEPIPPEEVEV